MTQQQQPPVLTIKMVKPGVELVLEALSRMPYQQVAPLIKEIAGQAEYQLQELQKQAELAPATEPTAPEGEAQ